MLHQGSQRLVIGIWDVLVSRTEIFDEDGVRHEAASRDQHVKFECRGLIDIFEDANVAQLKMARAYNRRRYRCERSIPQAVDRAVMMTAEETNDLFVGRDNLA